MQTIPAGAGPVSKGHHPLRAGNLPRRLVVRPNGSAPNPLMAQPLGGTEGCPCHDARAISKLGGMAKMVLRSAPGPCMPQLMGLPSGAAARAQPGQPLVQHSRESRQGRQRVQPQPHALQCLCLASLPEWPGITSAPMATAWQGSC